MLRHVCCAPLLSQAGYDAAVSGMHELMQQLDSRLADSRFLLGDRCGCGRLVRMLAGLLCACRQHHHQDVL